MWKTATLWGFWGRPLRSGDCGDDRYALGILGMTAALWGFWGRLLRYGDCGEDRYALGILGMTAVLWGKPHNTHNP